MNATPLDFFWILVIATLAAAILISAFAASLIIQQRRLLRTTRSFGGRLLTAQEDERRWMARELHDDIIQRVVMLGHEVDEIASLNGSGAAEFTRRAGGLRAELDDLAEEVRRLAHRMHPTTLEHLGLSAALEQLAGEFRAQGLDVRVRGALPEGQLSPEAETCLFRVAQEGLRNVLKHAGTRTAMVRLGAEADGALLEVADGGVGFDRGWTSTHAGLGITSLSERVRLLNGRLTIRSRPGQGTSVTAWIPPVLRLS
ncbi:MAG TPA: sensor histidine kinase [Gemmatimonadales bacterium]|jgi:signal transduction histidine kinase|nr:sensor histidine kinase [Gemmatimonadales bacterium]